MTEPRPLYLSRKVTNGDDIAEWAKSQGFTSILDPKDMHVTVAYSDAPIVWDDLGESFKTITVRKPSTRSIQLFDGGAVVLTIENGDLARRWQEAIDAGASWKYEDYSPHITITYEGADDLVLENVKPFDGPINLGKEVFATIERDWKSKTKERDLDVEMDDLGIPHAYWLNTETSEIIDCDGDDHARYIAHHYRKMGLDYDTVVDIIRSDGDDEVSEIEAEELCDFALEDGWVMGMQDVLHGASIDFLRDATRIFSEKWPNIGTKLCLRHRWEKVFKPDMIKEFVADGMLPEGVEEEPNLPRKFWMVFDIRADDDARSEKVLADLKHGTLEGVKGISDTREIITQFFYVVGNAALVMDSHAVMQKNDLRRIEYTNPAAILNDDMAILYRLFAKTRTKNGYHGLMQNIIQYVIREMRPLDYNLWHLMDYYGFQNRVAEVYQIEKTGNDSKTISSLSELTAWIVAAVKEVSDEGGRFRSHLKADFELLEPDDTRFETAVRQAVSRIGHMYSNEGEWVVANEAFIVPEKSILMLLIDKRAVALYPEWKADPDSIRFMAIKHALLRYEALMKVVSEYGLDQRYQVKLIDSMQYAKISSATMTRRRNKKS